jgi:hypothetical protein
MRVLISKKHVLRGMYFLELIDFVFEMKVAGGVTHGVHGTHGVHAFQLRDVHSEVWLKEECTSWLVRPTHPGDIFRGGALGRLGEGLGSYVGACVVSLNFCMSGQARVAYTIAFILQLGFYWLQKGGDDKRCTYQSTI